MNRPSFPLALGLLLVLLSGIIPPWESVYQEHGLKQITRPQGWAPLWNPPGSQLGIGLRVNFSILPMEWLLIATLLTLVLLLQSSHAWSILRARTHLPPRSKLGLMIVLFLALSALMIPEIWERWRRMIEAHNATLTEQRRNAEERELEAAVAGDPNELRL